MKINEIRELSTEALQARVNDAREELMRLRFQQSTGELTDTSRMRQIRRDVARMLTVLNQRLQAAETEGK